MSTTTGIRTFLTKCLLIAVPLLAAAMSARAQDERRFTVNAGAGFSPLVGQISDRLNNGWHVTVGGGYRFTRHFETNLQFTYNGFGVKPLVLQEADVPAANSHLWSLTVNPKLRLHPVGRLDPYFTGAVGYYRRTIQFTQPTLAPIDIFDPFFGFFFFPTLVQANIVLGNVTRGGVGGNAGAGFDFPFVSDTRLFIEAAYQYASTGSIPTRMVPVTLGVRW
jgi:opacity protein-like surface antigen